ncbi:MAG TPA: hypothetical protein VIW92_07615 [Thermoanaerobaculia bacterium]
MQKRNGRKLLGLTMVVLACLVTSMGPVSQAAKAQACCTCSYPACHTSCHYECGSNEACLNACVDKCEQRELDCMDRCPYPIC